MLLVNGDIMRMHVAVIGAGAAGLCTARHLTTANSGFTCVIYEQTGGVGGTWVYTEATGRDEYGLPISSAMYKNLRTNLPKENMEFPGFPYLNPKSFTSAAEVLQYLEDYSNHYDLKKHIKFFHHVKSIIPKEGKWQVAAVDLQNNREFVDEFDAVVVCNGHYSVPRIGNFPGISDFEGQVQHSHSYRIPEPFANKTVLVCGGGPSGVDITFDLAKFATKVYFSHKADISQGAYPENVEEVPVVKLVKKDRVIFEDGTTSEPIDVILICTGYNYSFPFLAPECGISVIDGKYIQPLYKHIINITYPTMGFIGIPFRTFIFPMFDYQVRYYLKSLKGEVQLPDKETMLAELEEYIRQKREQGVPLRMYHEISREVKSYMEELGTLANLEPLLPVYYNIFYTTAVLRKNHLKNYRDAVFEVVNECDFKVSGLQVDKEELAGPVKQLPSVGVTI